MHHRHFSKVIDMTGAIGSNRIVVASVCLLVALSCALAISFGLDNRVGFRRETAEFNTADPEAPHHDPLESPTPRMVQHDGYVSSTVCLECHHEEFDSWHKTFHRTMTQLATPQTIVASFDKVKLEKQGQVWQLEQRGDQFWVDTIDPIWERSQRARGRHPYLQADPPRLEAQIVMTTGSHHRQSYWISSGDPKRGNQLYQIPWTYQIYEQKWIPLDDAFMQPTTMVVKYSCWSDNCINCHSVAGKPGSDPEYDFVDSSVAELGISCEACHGPGKRHVDFYREQKDKDQKPENPLIVNPNHCTPQTSTQICGGCHSFSSSHDIANWWKEGKTFRPGQDLEKVRKVIHFAELSPESTFRDGFWDDGTVRTGGREYHGISMSACYQKGKLGCLSCHSMHDSEPDHQLANRMESNHACTTCHDQIASDITGHTRHAADSSGSLCYNCHMPYTSYALLSVLRSHRIDSPSVRTDVEFGRPNACNLCHLDKTLTWTDNHLSSWFGSTKANLDREQREIAASLLWILRGDPAQRVVAAGNFGLHSARAISGASWMAPFLATLFEDPYSAVRWVAYESLKKQPLFANFDFDFVGSAEYRSGKKDEVINLWRQQPAERTDSEMLFQADGSLDLERLQRLLSNRNDRNIQITE